MARSRIIKPGFFRNEHLVAMPMATRILFAGLWTLADREGRLEDRPLKIKMDVFPADDVDVDAALDQLATAPEPFIVRYESQGVRIIEVINWHDHQRPHCKEAVSVLPAPKTTPTKVGAGARLGAKAQKQLTSSKKQVTSNSPEGESEGGSSDEPTDAERFVAAWNTTAGVKAIQGMSDKRLKSFRARASGSVNGKPWLEVLIDALATKFPLKCFQDGKWQPDGDWILRPDSLLKIVEGKYDWTKPPPNEKPTESRFKSAAERINGATKP